MGIIALLIVIRYVIVAQNIQRMNKIKNVIRVFPDISWRKELIIANK